MTQALALNRIRVPVIAILALAIFVLGTLTGMSLPRLSVGAAPQSIVVQVPATSAGQSATVSPALADATVCGAGAYVSGDIAGDANPAAVYATMCGKR